MIWKWIFFNSLVTFLSVNISHFYYFYRYTFNFIKLDTTHFVGDSRFWFKGIEKYFDPIRKLFSPKPLDQYPHLAKTTYVKEHASWFNDRSCIFSSPELKIQVSFSFHLSSVLCLSVRLSIRPSVCKPSVVLFFSRTTRPISIKLRTKHNWMWGIQVCSNEGLRPFPRGDNYEIAKYIYEIKKKFSPEPLSQFQRNLPQCIRGWKGLKFVQMTDRVLFHGEIITN